MREGNRRRRWIAAAVGIASLAGFAFAAAPALASIVSVEGSSLRIDGDIDDDAITLSSDGTNLTIVDTGTGGATDGDTECSQVSPTTVSCAISPGTPLEVRGFSVDLNDGVDSFTNQNFAALFGQVGSPGASGAKTINGGPGTQQLFGGLDSDILNGGPGDDLLFDGSQFGAGAGSAGNDVLDGGEGIDETQYSRQGSAPLSISADGLANDGAAGESDNVIVENIATGNGNDVIVGNAGANVLAGLGGDDQIQGLGGNDELFGEFGADGIGFLLTRGLVLQGGDDSLDGGGGRDRFDCGRGFDLALHDPTDEIDSNCERIGAEVAGDSATVSGKKKNKLKVEVACPESEVAACVGKMKISAAGKKVGKGKFSVGAGKSDPSKAKLTKKGVKALKKAGGSLLVTVEATTEEPGGISVNDGRILIHD